MNTKSPLFDQLERTDTTHAAYTESQFAFLDRVAGPYWEQVRQLLDEWFAQIPPEHKDHLRTRFQNSDDRQHRSAFWELYLHELFRRLGFTATHHPELPGSSNQPDFLFERGDDAFYLEAVMLGDSDKESREERQRWQVLEMIKLI